MQIKKVKISELRLGPIRHEKLPDGFIARIQHFKKKLNEVETTSLEEAVSNFQRDLHPENELRIWEHATDLYVKETKANPQMSIQEKRACLRRYLFPQ